MTSDLFPSGRTRIVPGPPLLCFLVLGLLRFSVVPLFFPALLHAAAPNFQTEIRPLLQEHCVECHGPKKQKANLRLDAKSFAFRGGEEGPALVPGAVSQSPLFERLIATEADRRMPPKGERLRPEQIELVRRWIEAGAVWPETDGDRAAATDVRREHWSVQPVRSGGEGPDSIDAFVQRKLAEKGLSAAPEADRRTLIRRLSFDLLGLPPAPERVERFVHDPDPEAYAKLVDEMLASAHYGERWARHWLDIAHYADTHGFERDMLRPNAWRYRDYVINALNADKPYDRFLKEQIAGDVLYPSEPEATAALGFLGAGPWDFVGHVETRNEALRRAARAGDLDDLVTQVMTASMGLTVNCARCHDHKLDPIAQREYYQLWAVFSGLKRGERELDAAEAKRLRETTQRVQRETADTRKGLLQAGGGELDLADLALGGDGLVGGRQSQGLDLRKGALTSEKLGFHADLRPNRLQKINWPAAPGDQPRFLKWTFVPDGKGKVLVDLNREVSGLPPTSGHFWDAVRAGPLHAQQSSTLRGIDFSSAGHSMLAMHANSGLTFDLALIHQTYGHSPLRLRALVGFGASPSAAASRADFSIYVDGQQRFQRLKMRKDESEEIDLSIPPEATTLTLIATDGGDGIGSDLLFLGDPKLQLEAPLNRGPADIQTRKTELRQRLADLEKSLRNIPKPATVYAVVSEPNPPVIRIQKRGNPEDPAQEVAPGGIAWVKHAPCDFGTESTPEGERRRALAEWIAHPDNPLTRRVIVNRLWHYHFGTGLVSTPSDFGLGGDRPSHPELLDWMAAQLLRHEWRLKPIHRLIVMSATYRQSSVAENSKAMGIDAQNRLLWRQNPRRLDAESLRDAVLAVSGNLNLERGGPGFRDFRYTEAYAPIYEYMTPDRPELWKRSIYRFVVRTTPHRFMTTLDCPDPANLTPARVQTTTALQALALSNNAFLLQQARDLARRVEGASEQNEAQIREVFRRLLQRLPTDSEASAARQLVAGQGLFELCRMILNANEFVYLD
jgi:hypothetical protein